MARGNVSNAATAALVLLLGLISVAAVARGAEWVVGDAKGWTSHLAGVWQGGRPIHAGDVLVFKYNPAVHNVVQVDEAGYNSCNPGDGARTYHSGNDRVTVPPGNSYFLCGYPGHCAAGMKIAVSAH